MAPGPDGAFYLTDWVFSSYPIHGRGRLWKLEIEKQPWIAKSEPETPEAALAKKKGVLFLAAHIGNGDVASAMLSLSGLPIHLISKQFRSKWLNDAWFNIRGRLGTRFIAPENSSFEVLRALRKNEIVVFVLDQFMGPPVGVETTFFGHRTGTAAGLATIASRTGSPVIPVNTYRRPDGRHVISFGDEIPFISTEGQERNQRDIQVMTQAYTDKIEEIVRQHPEQWMWIHRRWKEFEVR
jgi:KDO2-lipid IV(A) lauroyltransferase